MKHFFQWLLFIGAIGSAGLGNAACRPIPGAEQLWSRPSLKWVWVGETHGSNEAPAAFAELVCNALASGKHVVVALERPTTEQAALQAMLTSQQVSTAKKILLDQPNWQDGQDGRSSAAMLQLLLSLRELHKQYPMFQVYAVDGPTYTADLGSRDEAIGKSVLSLGTEAAGNLILVLTGNVHAMKGPLFGYPTSAMMLPVDEIVSLVITNLKDSQAWIDNSTGCGAQKAGVADKNPARLYGIYLDPSLSPVGNVDGVFALGAPLTASSPAIAERSPLPDCRKIFWSNHLTPSLNP